ncbi:MAG TPA: FAD-dependent monooxygenase, partial [Vicinamibacterales bacterium]
MRVFDAVVVGAGPAGAMAARDLGRRGARVALVDGSHPREKPCGGGVTGRALDLVLAGAEIPAGCAIDAVTFEAGGRRARVALPGADHLRVFSREAFDAALVRQATDAGAELLRSRVTSIARVTGRWTIRAGADTVDAPWLLGADGAGGLIRKQVFRPFERRQLSIAAGSYVDGVDTTEIVIRFIDALNQSAGIRDVMTDLVAGRQPYQGLKRRLLGTLEVGLMWQVLIG